MCQHLYDWIKSRGPLLELWFQVQVHFIHCMNVNIIVKLSASAYLVNIDELIMLGGV